MRTLVVDFVAAQLESGQDGAVNSQRICEPFDAILIDGVEVQPETLQTRVSAQTAAQLYGAETTQPVAAQVQIDKLRTGTKGFSNGLRTFICQAVPAQMQAAEATRPTQ